MGGVSVLMGWGGRTWGRERGGGGGEGRGGSEGVDGIGWVGWVL